MSNRLRETTLTCALAVSSSLAAAIGVLLPSLWFLAPIGLSIFFYMLWHGSLRASTSFWTGLLFGGATSGAGIWWFWDTPPLGWLSVTDPMLEVYAVGVIWLTVSISMGLAIALASLVLWYLRNNQFLILATGCVWALAEEMRMIFFSIYTMGDKSLVGAHFSVAALGYTFAENSHLLQLASFGGLMVLNFAIALMAAAVAVLVYFFYTKKKVFVPALLILIFFSILPFFALKSELSQEPLRVAVIGDTVIPSMERDPNRGMRNLEDIAQIPVLPDMLLFPEGQNIWGAAREVDPDLTPLFGNHEMLILNSNYQVWTDPEKIGARNSSVAELAYWSTTQGLLATYQKIFLMPHGEYAPFTTSWLLSLSHDESVEKYLLRIGTMIPGNKLVSVPFRDYVIGGLLCSDGLSPRLFQTLAHEKGATILADLSNFGWFHGSRSLFDKSVQIGKVHAVAGRAWFFQAGNQSPAFAIDPTGKLIAVSSWTEPQVLIINLPSGSVEIAPLTPPKTPFL